MQSDKTKIGNPLLEKSFGKNPNSLNELINTKINNSQRPPKPTQPPANPNR